MAYVKVQEMAQRLGIFSLNETLEDVLTTELKYFVLLYHLGTLYGLRTDENNRSANLKIVLEKYREFLRLCSHYELIPKGEWAELEIQIESGTPVKLESPSRESRRDAKIRRYKLERSLQQKIDELSVLKNSAIDNEELDRALALAVIQMAIYSAVQEMESSETELKMLIEIALHQAPDKGHTASSDSLERPRAGELDWRLDIPKKGFLNEEGKVICVGSAHNSELIDQVLSPFVITSKREQLRDGVRGYDHSLPSMSIEEYLEQESARGGILAAPSGNNHRKNSEGTNNNTSSTDTREEEERIRSSRWDEFVENNPKGIGNTMNRG